MAGLRLFWNRFWVEIGSPWDWRGIGLGVLRQLPEIIYGALREGLGITMSLVSFVLEYTFGITLTFAWDQYGIRGGVKSKLENMNKPSMRNTITRPRHASIAA